METAVVELTKEQRHEVYKLALVKAKRDRDNKHLGSMCVNAMDSIKELFQKTLREASDLVSKEGLPELFNKKPVKLHGHSGAWWFPADDYSSRIAILEACIKETQP